MEHPEHPQIYLATPLAMDTHSFAAQLSDVLDAAPVACLQMRAASEDMAEVTNLADMCREVAHQRDIPLVIHKYSRLVEPLGLDGVHITDGRLIRDLRKTLGPDAIIGCGCGNSRHDGMGAAEAGADYISFGPVGTDLTGTEPAPLEIFQWWSDMIELPVIAEGAITPEAAKNLRDHVDFFALGDEIWSAPNPAEAMKTYAKIASGT